MPSPPLSIVQSLSPRVAVLSSDGVIQACEANGCRGMEELLRPWEGSTDRVSILSSTLTPTIHPTFPLRFVPFDLVYPNPAAAAPDPGMVVDMISSFVGERKPDEEQHYPLTRSLLLSTRPIAAYETFNHPVSVLFAVSSADADPLAAMKRLVQKQVGALQTVPWMDAVNVLKFYVIVHDASSGVDAQSAIELLALTKRTYGNHCTLLTINSKEQPTAPPLSPDISTHPSIPLPRPLDVSDGDIDPSTLSQIYASALSSLTLSPQAAASAAMGQDVVAQTSVIEGQPPRRKLYAARLDAEDTQRLVALVRELVVQSLIPWMEARIREWNEVYHANRRGITGRLFGAGRKLFGSRPSSPAQNSAQAGYNSVKGYYPIAAIEALSRRLADFAFMLRDYRYASGVYDSLRRDFAQDRAMRYAAAATEMYGLSLLLSHGFFLPSTPPRLPPNPFTNLQHTDISSWLEQAVEIYYSSTPTGAGMALQLDALRATVLYYEAWKTIGERRGVGQALVTAAGDAEEVAGAVMIEEAATADTRGGKTDKGRRRRAFNLVLAARRYETAGLKAHSRRCLDRAASIYRTAPWNAAQDRISYSLGRQSYASGDMAGAVQHFMTLLARNETGVPGSQAGPLQDMELAYEQLATHPDQLEAARDNMRLPDPIFDIQRTRVITQQEAAVSYLSPVDGEGFEAIEMAILDGWDRKGKKPMRLLPESGKAVASFGEMLHVELIASNPLNCPLTLSSVTIALDPPIQGAEIASTDDLLMEPYETRSILLPISLPSSAPATNDASPISSFTVSTVSFRFNRFCPVTQLLAKRGKRLHASKAQRLNATYGPDTSLKVELAASRPRIRAEWVYLPAAAYEGEEVHVGLRIELIGGAQAVQDLELWAAQPDTQSSSQQSNKLRSDPRIRLSVDRLELGEARIVPLILDARAPTAPSGRLDLSTILVCQGSDPAGTESDAPAIGHVCISASISVQPILRITADIRPSKDGSAAYLNVTNASGSNVRLDKIMPISPYWQSPSLDVSERVESVILPRQTVRVRLFVSPPVEANDGDKLDPMQRQVVEQLALLVQNKPLADEALDHGSVHLRSSNAEYRASRADYRTRHLRSAFPAMTTEQIERIFPLFDPLDLDIAVRYSILSSTVPDEVGAPIHRSGTAFIHGLRPAASFSLVEPLREQVARELESGNKSTRTMYEETGRIRRIMVDSILDGVLAKEDDPVILTWAKSPRSTTQDEHNDESGMEVVQVRIRNTSSASAVRWVLRLSPSHTRSSDANKSTWIGGLLHRGQLAPNGETTITCSMVHSAIHAERGVLGGSDGSLPGWELEVETGSNRDHLSEDLAEGVIDTEGARGMWVPRMTWHRTGGM